MKTRLWAVALAGAIALGWAPTASAAQTLHVASGAPSGGDGTRDRPFASLKAVMDASDPGDTIVVLPGKGTLDGGIVLQPRQALKGEGGSLANSAGDAVTLADDVEVSGLKITEARRGGIYGANVSGVDIHDNDITGTNTACSTGFVVQPFVLPTLVPGVGVPFESGLSNGWAAIMIDADTGKRNAFIHGNTIHDGTCADGVDVRASGVAAVTVRVQDNVVTRMKQDPRVQSVLAIGTQTRDTASLDAQITGNTETYIGTPGLGDFGNADSEGLFANASGSSHLTVHADRNTFAHGLGHLSANCVEAVTSNGGPTIDFTLTNSTCDTVVGDILEAINASRDATIRMRIDHVIARTSTFPLAQAFAQAEPGDDGDCLLVVASGAGSTTEVTVANSLLTDCVADGIGQVANATDGTGPIKKLSVDVRNSRVTGNDLTNLRVANVTPVTRLEARFERTDLSSAGTLLLLEALDTAKGTGAKLDIGGGSLGSSGRNCLFGGKPQSIASVGGFPVTARANWWGAPSGPPAGRVVGEVDVSSPLVSADCGPAAGEVVGPLPISMRQGAARRCTSRRRFTIRLPRAWRTATVTVGGRRVTVRRRSGRLTAIVDLRGRGRGTVTVRARGVTRGGKRRAQTRTFRPCTRRGTPGDNRASP